MNITHDNTTCIDYTSISDKALAAYLRANRKAKIEDYR